MFRLPHEFKFKTFKWFLQQVYVEITEAHMHIQDYKTVVCHISLNEHEHILI